MNRNQKIALAVGLLAFLLNFAFPPRYDFWGLGPVISGEMYHGPIHWNAVLVQWFIVAVLAAGLVAILGGRRHCG